MSAVSNRLTPLSMQISISFFASSTPVSPQARKNSLPPPKVPAPKLRTGTFRPEWPSCLYSICDLSMLHRGGSLRQKIPAVGVYSDRSMRRPPDPQLLGFREACDRPISDL